MTKCLLYYLLPWLYNMELVDANLGVIAEAACASDKGAAAAAAASSPTVTGADKSGGGADHNAGGGREGWGTAEATEMITNNLFYITVKFGDDHPKEVEELWSALCACWPRNLTIIIRYLFIVTGMAPNELVEYVSLEAARLLDIILINESAGSVCAPPGTKSSRRHRSII